MKRFLLLLLLLLLPVVATAEVRVIEIQHRSVAALLEKVRSLLTEGEKVEAAGSHLILVASGESLEAALQMIRLLDQPQRNLMIRVRQQSKSQVVGSQGGGTIRYSSKTGVSTEGQAGLRIGNSSATQEQRLMLLEGTAGQIEIGREIPYTQQWMALTGETTGYAETTTYRTIATGFWIMPEQVLDNRVRVTLEPYLNDAQQRGSQPPQIEFSQLRTQLLVPLGEWYPLGAQLRKSNEISRAIIAWRSDDGHSDRSLEIRIDPVE